jgi:hypothetical protein
VLLFTLITERPWWFILFCILLGAAYALILYPYKTLKPVENKKPKLLWLMTGLRFFTVSFLAFLLMSPLIKSYQVEVQKPIIVLAQDNSASILLNKDSAFYRTDYLKNLEALKNTLNEKFDVKFYSFGKSLNENPTINFNEKQTNISALMDAVYDKYEGQNLGAVILASDGTYNQGSNPIYSNEKLKTTIYTIALGDTAFPRDVFIKRVRSNAIAYLGNSFPIEIEAMAYGYNGRNLTVSVIHNGQVESIQNIVSTSSRFSKTLLLNFDAKAKGMQRYTITISRQVGELSYLNNIKDVFIDVIDGRQKILLLADAPHPDLGALKNAIETNQNYEVQIVYANELPSDVSAKIREYSLVILHQLPSTDYSTKNVFDALDKIKMPRLYILGSRSNLPVFNSLNDGLSISNNRGNYNDALPKLTKDFNLFTLSDETINAIDKFPPLQAPFGTYAPAGDARGLFQQQIGSTVTDMPLVMFSNKNDHKTGIISGEGIWRWRLQEYAQNQSQSASNEVLTKIIQYLSAKDDKRLLRITSSQKTFEENENVMFDAEVYTPSYELTNEPEVSFKITNEEGKTFDYQFSKSGRTYHLDCGILPVGSYRYTAGAATGGKNEMVSGQFTIFPLQAEFTETVANHQLLATLSNMNNGKLFYPAEMQNIAREIDANATIKPVSYAHQHLQDLVNLKWIFGLLLFTISMEWFFRKREGGY